MKPWLHLLLPATCPVCGQDQQTPWRFPICRSCWRTVHLDRTSCMLVPELDDFHATFQFDGALRKLLHEFKYARRYYLADMLTRRWARRPPFDFKEIEVVVPVPMPYWRRFHRGYNPAELLAQRVALQWKLSVRSRWLARRLKAPSQTQLNRQEREKNARAAYVLKIRRPLNVGTVLLVDDVSTTGATLRSCARLLKQAGVRRVLALVVARDVDVGVPDR